jgi:hypothetical protein
MLTDRADGHTWNEQPSGYAIRQCAIRLPCSCQQPKPAEGPPAFDMRTRQMAGKSRETPIGDRTERASRKLFGITTRARQGKAAAIPRPSGEPQRTSRSQPITAR